jgi:hypothetical protein
MFNTTIIDVAIGIIFVYLLLSLISSAAHEMIEYWLKKRSSDLERGVRELLTKEDGSDPGQLVEKLYNHGMVSGLFKGTYQNSRIGKVSRYFLGTRLPSYIPSRNFALALMDLVAPGTASQPSGATNATPPPPPDVKLTTTPGPPPPPTDGTNPLNPLRQAISTTPVLKDNERAQKAIISLVDAAGSDVSKARENIETWFNNGMDRVSGWYKRRSQIFIFVIGLVVTIGLNADSVTIAKKLSSDRALRESLVAAADAYAKANAMASPVPSPTPGAASTPAPPTSTPTPKPAATPKPTPIPTPNTASTAAATPTPTSDPCSEEACQGNPESSQCKLKKSQCAIEGLGLPIGWDMPGQPRPGESADEIAQRNWPGLHFWDGGFWSGWAVQFRIHFFGWLLTALAISLGAPFWFDTLNKFIVVRSTVKPKEKSADEPSKS